MDGEHRMHDPAAAMSAVVTGFVGVVLVLRPAVSAFARPLSNSISAGSPAIFVLTSEPGVKVLLIKA